MSTDTRPKMAITMIKKKLVMFPQPLILLLIDTTATLTTKLVITEVCYNLLLKLLSNLLLLLIIALVIYIGHDNYDRNPDDNGSSTY